MATHGAFIVARYSTDNQNPDSIEVQVERCQKWCEEKGLPVLGIYADMAVSGMKDTRPQFEAMMRDVRQGLADTVVMYDQSRMFRKMSAWFSFRDEMSRIGVTVASVTQPNIGGDLRDPMNFMSEGAMALFNQIWALQTSQKAREKLRYMAEHGQHTGGKPALGYHNVDGHLEIKEDEAKIVRRIFREYADGKSYKKIIDGLNADGIKTKRGNSFGSNSLHDLLKNEKYVGTLVYGGKPYREDGSRNTHGAAPESAIRIEDALPAIISKDLFQAVQERMEENRKVKSGRPPKNRSYPLSGKVFCGDCKSAMTVSISQGRYAYYRCSGKKRLHNCDMAPISVDTLEKIVASRVRQIFGKPENLDELLEIMRIQADSVQDGAVGRLRSLLEKERQVDWQLNNAVNAVLGGLNSTAITAKIHSLEKEKAKIKNDITRLRKDVAQTAVREEELRKSLANIVSAPEGNNEAIFAFVARVDIYKDAIEIWTVVSPDPENLENTDDIRDELIKSVGTASGVPSLIITCSSISIVTPRKL